LIEIRRECDGRSIGELRRAAHNYIAGAVNGLNIAGVTMPFWLLKGSRPLTSMAKEEPSEKALKRMLPTIGE